MAEPYRVLLTGSRTWSDEGVIHEVLSDLLFKHHAMTLVHGACPRGADQIADQWARQRNSRTRAVSVERHPADWKEHGRAAGIVRNAEMVKLGADVCLAFIQDGSRGASWCATAADLAGIPTRRFERFSHA